MLTDRTGVQEDNVSVRHAVEGSGSGEALGTYRAVAVTRRGGPEVLRVVERDLRQPDRDEVRIKVLAASVSAPDVQARYGHSPFRARIPFIPGYSVIGDVDAVGSRVTAVAQGDRVAALTIYGGYAEFAYVRADRLIPVPAGLDPAEAVPLILNYLVAYQVLHRAARVSNGDKVLLIGASGGIGTALLQLGRLAGLRMYGLASSSKHPVLREYGAVPIDYRSQDFIDVIRRAEPAGLDVIVDGVVAREYRRACALLRRGGMWVGYGKPVELHRDARAARMGRPCQPGPWAYREAVQHGQVLPQSPTVRAGLGDPFHAVAERRYHPDHSRPIPPTCSGRSQCFVRDRPGGGQHRPRSIVNSDSGPG